MNSKLKELLTTYASQVAAEMRTRLSGYDKIATGKLIKSIRGTVQEEDGDPVVVFSMLEYGIYVDKGRKPGKMPPVSKIREWCKVRGIEESAAFPIARAIGERGIAPTNFFSISVKRRQKQLKKNVAKVMKEEILKAK